MLKILLTAGVIYAVWLLYKYRSRIAAVHKTVMEENARDGERKIPRAGSARFGAMPEVWRICRSRHRLFVRKSLNFHYIPG